MKLKLPAKNSVVLKIGTLMMFVVLLQAIFAAGVVFSTGVTHTLESYSDRLFTTLLQSRKSYLDDKLSEWSDISAYRARAETEYLIATMETAEPTEEMITTFFDGMVDVLKEMALDVGGTGGFIILDDGELGDITPAIYISSDSYSNVSDEERPFYMEVGPSSISADHGFSLASSWSYGLLLDEDNINTLKNPILATEYTDNHNYQGYWNLIDSPTSNTSDTQAKVLTYSVPMFDSEGVPVGVIGIEIAQNYLYKSLPSNDFSESEAYGYAFASVDKTTLTMSPLMTQGTLQKSILEAGELQLVQLSERLENDDLLSYSFDSSLGDICAYFEPLELYPLNSPFEDEAIYLLGMTTLDSITYFSENLSDTLINMVILTIIVGIMVSYLMGYDFVAPILELTQEMSQLSASSQSALTPTGIAEIDELANTVQTLHRDVLKTAYKSERILEMLEVGVGYFDYIDGQDKVSVSEYVQKEFDFDVTEGDEYVYSVDSAIFFSALYEKKKYPFDEMEEVYQTSLNPPEWHRIAEILYDDQILGVFIDVTNDVLARKAISYERDYDMLTGILNRAAFQRKAQSLFDKKALGVAAFVMLDLDNLKYVNDTFGHDMGDMYIKTAAQVLSTTFEHSAVVGRMSGDEFYVFFYGFDNAEDIITLIGAMYHRLDTEPIVLPDGSEFKIRLSSGISWHGKDSEELDELIRFADFAMYEGKHTLKGELREFNKARYLEESFMLSGKEELNRVLDNQFVNFVFQPVVNTRTGDIYAYEALMRPESEILNTPTKLLQIATAQSKLWMVEKITFFKAMSLYVKHRELFGDSKISINSMPSHLLKDTEYQEFERLYGEHLSRLVVEIIETEKLDEDSFTKKLELITKWGASIALDDYGSGYNSDLSVLHMHPSVVKIDRVLVENVDTDESRQAMITKILDFCRKQNIKVLAEGVETKEQAEYLINMGIDYLQGYYISRPLPLPNFDNSEFIKLLDGMGQGA